MKVLSVYYFLDEDSFLNKTKSIRKEKTFLKHRQKTKRVERDQSQP